MFEGDTAIILLCLVSCTKIGECSLDLFLLKEFFLRLALLLDFRKYLVPLDTMLFYFIFLRKKHKSSVSWENGRGNSFKSLSNLLASY